MIKLCQECGGRAIEFTAYVRPNEDNRVSWIADDSCHVWCDDCEAWGVGAIDLVDASRCVAQLLNVFADLQSWERALPCGHIARNDGCCLTCERIQEDLDDAGDTLACLRHESETRGAWSYLEWMSHLEAIETTRQWLETCQKASART